MVTGIAGTPSSDVISVQGISGGVAVPTSMAAVPTGGSTEAKQDTLISHVDLVEAKLDTLIGHLDGVEGQLTTLNAIDFATEAKQDAAGVILAAMAATLEAIEDAVAATHYMVAGTAVWLQDQLDDLANNGKFCTAEQTPTANQDWANLRIGLQITTGDARTGTPTVKLWVVRRTDDTNYESAGTTPFNIAREPDAIYTFTAQTGTESVAAIIPKPHAGKYKLLFQNLTGVTITASDILITPEGTNR